MATTVSLSNPSIVVDAVDFTDQCTQVVVTQTVEALEASAFGDTARKYVAGLGSHEVTATFMLAYDTNEVEEKLNSLVGTNFNVEVYAAASVTPGVTNPEYTLTGCFLSSITPINGSVGDLPTVDCTFQGGALTRATS
jgi:hypothetical protein